MTPSTYTIHITPVQRPGKYGPQWRVEAYCRPRYSSHPGRCIHESEGQLEAGLQAAQEAVKEAVYEGG